MLKLTLFLSLALLSNMSYFINTSAILPNKNPRSTMITIPEEYQHLNLIKCSLSKMEKKFSNHFPGTIETYRHDKGIIIFRKVTGATRKLHDSKTCLKSSGFHTSATKTTIDKQGRTWQNFSAKNRKNSLAIRSIIQSCDSSKSWPSVQQWFWSAFFSQPSATYLAITEISDQSELRTSF